MRPQKAVEAGVMLMRTKIELIVEELNEMRNAVETLAPKSWKLSCSYQLQTPSFRLKNGNKLFTYTCESGSRSKEQDPSLIIDPPNHSLFAIFLAATSAAALAASTSASALKKRKLKKSASKQKSKANNNKDDFKDGSDDDLDNLTYNTAAVGAKAAAGTTTAELSDNDESNNGSNDGFDDELDKLNNSTAAVGAKAVAGTTTAASSTTSSTSTVDTLAVATTSGSSTAATEAPKKRKLNSGSEFSDNDDSNNGSNDGFDDELDKLKNSTAAVGAKAVAGTTTAASSTTSSTSTVDTLAVATTSGSSTAPKKRKLNTAPIGEGATPVGAEDAKWPQLALVAANSNGKSDNHESTSPAPSVVTTSNADTWSNQSNRTIDAGKRISFQYLSADANALANHDKFLQHLGVYVVNELQHKTQLEQLVKEYFVLVCCKQNPSRAGWANELEFLGEIFVHWFAHY